MTAPTQTPLATATTSKQVHHCFNCGEPTDWRESTTGLWVCGDAECDKVLSEAAAEMMEQAQSDAEEDDHGRYMP